MLAQLNWIAHQHGSTQIPFAVLAGQPFHGCALPYEVDIQRTITSGYGALGQRFVVVNKIWTLV